MRKVLMIFSVCAVLAMSGAVNAAATWNAWDVHAPSTDYCTESSGTITMGQVPSGGTSYQWEDYTASNGKTGVKSFYSTSYMNGQTIADIESLTWDTADGAYAPYVNIFVENSSGEKAILAPNDNTKNGNWSDMMSDDSGDQFDFYVYEGTDFSGDNTGSSFYFGNDMGSESWCTYAEYGDVKDMTIIDGGFQMAPADETGSGDDYSDREANWNHWASGAQNDGIAFVWGARKPKTNYTVGDAEFSNVSLVPEPATLCLLGLGGLMLRRRKKA